MNSINTLRDPAKKCDYTVAVIDTDKNLNHRISEQLRNAGCTVLQAFGSDEIDAILAQHPNFIIVDPIYQSCDELALYDYLKSPESAGVVVFTSNPNHERRDSLFECGILECFYKEEPLREIINDLLHLFETIQTNIQYRICIISDAEATRQKLRKLISHRHYRACFLKNCHEIKEKWEYQAHDFPDVLVIDLNNAEHFKETFEFIHYARIQKLLEIPIVVLLDSDEHNLSPKLYRAGVNDVLVAPYSHEKLLSMITHHLDYRISKKRLKYEHSLSSQLKAMIDSSSIVSKADPKGIITYVNEEFCHSSGYTKAELIGQPHNIIRHPDNSPMLFEQMWQTLRNKKIFHGIIKNRRKDGTTYYVDSTIAPVLDDNEAIMEYISIRHDVTPLIEKQHEIEEQRRQIQNVLDAQTSLICMVDKIEGVRQSNSNFMKFLGIESLRPETCGCKNLHELFLEVEGAFTVKQGERYVWLDRLYEMRDTFVKVMMQDRFGNHHVFAIHVEKIPDNRFTKGVCYLVTLDNVTELNRALREAKASSEAESRFLATMSHEIRTPLNGILGFSELLSETDMDDQQLKYLKAITSSGETLRQIINDILDVMKMEREQLDLTCEPITIINELEAMIYPFYAQAAKKGVDLLVYLDPKLPEKIDTDLLRLKQILINLISNAIKFTAHGKKVYVRIKKLKTENEKVTIGFTVADEGIGVKPEQKANIFKAFVQADNSISREYGGTGLGLNIVMRVLSAMGGDLSFKSILGRGSVFHTALEFTFNSQASPYQCQHHTTHLYLPFGEPSARFRLIERYLKGFACCDTHLCRASTLDDLPDHSDLHIILFMESMSVEEILDVSKRFTKAKLFIIPASTTNTPLSFAGNNVFCLTEELSWSTIAKRLEIDDQRIPVQPKQHESATFQGLRVLVAEDNDVNQLYIQELLKKLKIDHDLACDGYEAVKKFISNTYDLVLMDINMPNMDGITATQQILCYEHDIGIPHTPIVGLSADAVAANITKYIQQGLDGYLIKPLQKKELVKILKELSLSHVHPKNTPETRVEPIMHPVKVVQKSLKSAVASQLELPEEIVTELFKRFISNAQVILTQIQENPDDAAQLKMTIHSLKGISKNLFLEPLGNACEHFEKEVASLSYEQKLESLGKICTETEKNIQWMKEELA